MTVPIIPGPGEPFTLATVLPASPPPPKSRPKWLIPLVGALALLLVGALAGVYFVGRTQPTPLAQPAVTASPTAAAPTTSARSSYLPPTPADFTLAVKILRQACFGSAGCNVTYTIEVAEYRGFRLEPGKTWDVTYSLTGGDDPQVGTFQLSRGESIDQLKYSTAREERTSTPSSTSVLVATVTSVSAH